MRESFGWRGVPNGSSSEEGDAMKKRIRRLLALAPFLAVAGGIMLAPTVVLASPVEYVKVCDIVPQPGYFYLPGTDFCVNTSTNDAVVNTLGGIWEWRSPDNPRTAVPANQPECEGGAVGVSQFPETMRVTGTNVDPILVKRQARPRGAYRRESRRKA